MAFVNRTSRKNDYISSGTSDQVGPFSYKQGSERKIALSCVPFNQSSRKLPEKKEKDITPGPGAYHQADYKNKEKIVVSSANEDIKIVEVPKQSSVFKSNSTRFQQKKADAVPGPGSYELKPTITVPQGIQGKAIESQQQQQPGAILDTLAAINRYQSIPSIPSKQHSFGYTENKQQELKLNKIPKKTHSGVGIDKIGPGHYQELNVKNNKKGTAWHKYQSRKKEKISQTAGPGQYDVQTSFIPLYKMKQSAAFVSQTVRTLEQQKGKISHNLLKQKQQREMAGIGQPSENNQEIIEDFVEDNVPAPGHYHNEAAMSSLKIQQKEDKYQFFGSSADRFQVRSQTLVQPADIGPGKYNPANVNLMGKKMHSFKSVNPPFLSSNTRFDVRSIQDSKPGPGQYEDGNNPIFISNMKKGYSQNKGNFGVQSKRFGEQENYETPGPGAYLAQQQEEQDGEEPQITYQFKSKNKRQIQQKRSQVPPVGSYNVDFFDIKRKQEFIEEEDPELQIRKPGFQSSAPRFKDRSLLQDDETAEDSIQQQENKKNIYAKQPQVQGVGFSNKAKRFNYKLKEQKPGPGQYYNPYNAANEWNKRTYNILFAEI